MATTPYTFVTNTGVIQTDSAAVYADVVAEWKAALGAALDTSPSTPQGQLIDAEVAARLAVAQNNASLANQINPNQAGGVFLLALCSLLGYQPPAATYTQVFANVTGTPNITIPAGSQAKTTAGDLFAASSNIVLGSNGTGGGVFQALDSGPVPCPVGALTGIVTAVLGWDSVTNPGPPSSVGVAELTDTEIRQQRRQTLALQGRGVAEAILAQVAQAQGVTSVAILQNPSGSTTTINSINLLAYSIWVCVQGGDPLAVATAIISGGVGPVYNGAVTQNVTEPYSGQVLAVKFDRPTAQPVAVRVTIKLPAGSTAGFADVINAVVSWANGTGTVLPALGIGTDVSPFEIAAAVNAAVGGYVAKVEVADGSATPPYAYQTTEYVIAQNQIATISNNQVEVVLL